MALLDQKIENAPDEHMNVLHADITKIITNLDLQNRKIARLASLMCRDNHAPILCSVSALGMTADMIEAHATDLCNKAELLRIRNSQARADPLVSDNVAIYTLCIYSVAVRLNPAAGTADCKQFILYAIIRGLAVHETAMDPLNRLIQELIANLQKEDTFVRGKQEVIQKRFEDGKTRKPSLWHVDGNGLLRH